MPPDAAAAPDRSLRNRALRALVALASPLSALPAQQVGAPTPALESYVAHLAAAEGAMARGANGAVWRWLDAVPPAQRCFAWHLLATEADRSVVTHAMHPWSLSSIAVSPDGALCAIGTEQGTIHLVATSEFVTPTPKAPIVPVRSIAAHRHAVHCVSFDAEGKRLASSSADRGAAVWDVATGAQLVTFANHTFPVGSIRFAPDGKRLCSSSYQRPKGGEIRIWDAGDGRELAVLQSGYAPMTCSHWSPDGKRIVGASWDQQLHVFDLTAPGQPLVVKLGADGSYRAAQASALSPDGTLIAVACKDDQVHLFEAWTGKPVRDFVGHTKIVEGVAFSPDGTLLATTSADTSVRLWDVASGSQLAALRGHRGLVRGVAFTADATRVLTCSADGTARAWDVAAARRNTERQQLPKTAYHVAERPDGTQLAIGDSAGALRLHDRADGRVGHELANDDGWIAGLQWFHAPEGPLQLAAGGRSTLRVWDVTAKTARSFADPAATQGHGCGAGIDGVAVDRASRWLAAVSRDRKARLWELATGRMLWCVDFAQFQQRVAFAPDGTSLGICGQAGAALHDATTGAVRAALTGHRGPVNAVLFTADERVLTLGEDGTLRTWKAIDGALTSTRPAHDGPGRAAALSPDGTRLATCGDDDRLVLWDVATGVEVWSRELDDGHCLAWSGDGHRLWAATLGKELRCFDAAPSVRRTR